MLDGERKRGWTSPVQLSTFSDWIVWQSLGKWRGRSLLHLQGDTSREISKLQQKWKQLEIYEGHLLDLHFPVWSTGRFIIHQTLEIFSEKKGDHKHEKRRWYLCFNWCISRAFKPVDKKLRGSKNLESNLRIGWDGMEIQYEAGCDKQVYGWQHRNQHHCWIKLMSRLLSKQVRKHDIAWFICPRYSSYFRNEQSLAIHDLYRSDNKATKVTMPREREGRRKRRMNLTNHNRFIKAPFVICTDFKYSLSRVVMRASLININSTNHVVFVFTSFA